MRKSIFMLEAKCLELLPKLEAILAKLEAIKLSLLQSISRNLGAVCLELHCEHEAKVKKLEALPRLPRLFLIPAYKAYDFHSNS